LLAVLVAISYAQTVCTMHGRLTQTFLATGCPNADLGTDLLNYWENLGDSSGYTFYDDMYSFCSVTKAGTASQTQMNVCCGTNVDCTSQLNTCVKQTSLEDCSVDDCPWLESSDSSSIMGCMDGTTCNVNEDPLGWSCCSTRGGRAQCPAGLNMCARPNSCDDLTDYCCEADCSSYDGERPCSDAPKEPEYQYSSHSKHPMYRWNSFSFYQYATTTSGASYFNEDQSNLYGGVKPSEWGEDQTGNQGSNQMDWSVDSFRALFTRNGPLVNLERPQMTHMNVFTESWKGTSSENGRIVAVLFRMYNANPDPTNWYWYFHISCYYGWGEVASISINGKTVWTTGTYDYGHNAWDTNLELQPGMNSIVVIAQSAAMSGNRMLTLGWYSDSLIPPEGVFYHDDLFDESHIKDMKSPEMRVDYTYIPTYSEGPKTPRKPQFPLYRFATWSTYCEYSSTYYGNDDAMLFGGIKPSEWVSAADAGDLDYTADVLRAFYNREGPMITEDTELKNSMIFGNTWVSSSTNNGQFASALFRIMNENSEETVWPVKLRCTSWSNHQCSIAVNGQLHWSSSKQSRNANDKVETELLLQPGMNTVVIVAGSTEQEGSYSTRSLLLAFVDNSLDLPAGLSYQDDLFAGYKYDDITESKYLRSDESDTFNNGAYFPLYRWMTFSTYSNGDGAWAMNNNRPELFGGVHPSNWGDGKYYTGHMDINNEDTMRALFTRNGPMVKNGRNHPNNMNYFSYEYAHYSSTDSFHIATYHKIYNANSYTAKWTINFCITSYDGWSEIGSILMNGNAIHIGYDSYGANWCLDGYTMDLNPGENTLIMVSAAGPPNNLRNAFLTINDNRFQLPDGCFFYDELYEESKYPSLVPSVSPTMGPSALPSVTCGSGCCYCEVGTNLCHYELCDGHHCYSHEVVHECPFMCDETNFMCSDSWRGIQTDLALPESMVQWVTIYDEPYSTATSHLDVATSADGLRDCVLVGARYKDEAYFRLAAFGRTHEALKTSTSVREANYDRGVYWYSVPGKSFGFSDVEQVSLQPMDILYSDSDEMRLSWTLDQETGGYRAGTSIDLESSEDWHKVLMSGPCEEVQEAPTRAPTVSDGVKFDFEVVSAGWTKVYDAPYNDPTSTDDLFGHDMGECILMGVREGGSPTLMVAAMGYTADITEDTGSDTVAVESKGVYWYNRPGAIGFASSANINLHPHDLTDPRTDMSRVSWHLDSDLGGWRAGIHTNLNDDTTFHKVFYTGSCDLQTGVPTESPTSLYPIFYNYQWPNYLGWKTTYNEHYTHATTSADITAGLDECMLVGAKQDGVSHFSIAAFGYSDVITQVTESDDEAHIDHGTYWYMNPGKAFGFAANWQIYIRDGADVTHLTTGADRLSWNLDNGRGGYRAGTTINLDGEDGNGWRKVIMTGPCDLITSYPTLHPTIPPTKKPTRQPTKSPSTSPLTVVTYDTYGKYLFAMSPYHCNWYDGFQSVMTANRCNFIFDKMKQANFIDLEKQSFVPEVPSVTSSTLSGCSYEVASKTLQFSGHFTEKTLDGNGDQFTFCEKFIGVSDECSSETENEYFVVPAQGRCPSGFTICDVTRLGRSTEELCFPTSCVDEANFEDYLNFRDRHYYWTEAEPYYGTKVTCGEMSAEDLMKQVIDQLYRSTCSN